MVVDGGAILAKRNCCAFRTVRYTKSWCFLFLHRFYVSLLSLLISMKGWILCSSSTTNAVRPECNVQAPHVEHHNYTRTEFLCNHALWTSLLRFAALSRHAGQSVSIAKYNIFKFWRWIKALEVSYDAPSKRRREEADHYSPSSIPGIMTLVSKIALMVRLQPRPRLLKFSWQFELAGVSALIEKFNTIRWNRRAYYTKGQFEAQSVVYSRGWSWSWLPFQVHFP